MTWNPVTMRWPSQATSWLADLEQAKAMAGSELASAGDRVAALQDLATTNPGPVGEAAAAAVAAGRSALGEALGEVPAALVVTPFQSGVGQGRGLQRYLSAPNLLQHLATKLEDVTDANRPGGEQYALIVMFVGTRYDHFATTLSRFNAVLPLPDLKRAQNRAGRLSELETAKWELPTAGTLPRWGALPLEQSTITRAASQAMSGQLAALESFASSSPLADLQALASRKAQRSSAKDQELASLKAMFDGATADVTMTARLIGPGNAAELRRDLLTGQAPSHEWPLSAGVMLVGSLIGLSFVRELVGL
ncbi:MULTISPECIES: hypothetical protein [unclassified Pseudomonas]|uniref:hypothetical protein n=1 Tax=unclassified Pseudomonas TaxID=196821 RepID=UPI001AE746F5|nr:MULTISPECIES: hypothetical protein [unclassified Pseudomonas]MBP2273755.1 hypothetical protein [Pseudomonas sp. BP6]MBP2287274.1 hypothetical protein [Pseudomonas sp. BP7]HDS1696328.1 hypothetical protein [Pseudomonas putida]HDS1703373.1 hypothetical protein [Pseudomonas putida]